MDSAIIPATMALAAVPVRVDLGPPNVSTVQVRPAVAPNVRRIRAVATVCALLVSLDLGLRLVSMLTNARSERTPAMLMQFAQIPPAPFLVFATLDTPETG